LEINIGKCHGAFFAFKTKQFLRQQTRAAHHYFAEMYDLSLTLKLLIRQELKVLESIWKEEEIAIS
jgi:hypothetical protein